MFGPPRYFKLYPLSCTLFLSVSVLLPFFVSSFLRFFVSSPFFSLSLSLPPPPVVAIISASPDQFYPVAQIDHVNLIHTYAYIDGLLYKYYMSTFSAFEKKNPLNPFSVLDFILKAYSRGFQRLFFSDDKYTRQWQSKRTCRRIGIKL